MKTTAARADSADLALQLGHRFADPALLDAALTHPSLAGARSRKKGGMAYERLEFLGDRVLGLVIAEWLYEDFPQADEGEMAKRHAALVNREALRAVAGTIDLGAFVRLAGGQGAGESMIDKDRKNLATLSDAMEAVIGALYLDGGHSAARNFIRQRWQGAVAVVETPDDPKTILQEWAQKQGKPLPVYKTVAHSGPAHAPHFVIEASVQGIAPVTAEGDSKRAAQKAAATLLLQTLTPQTLPRTGRDT